MQRRTIECRFSAGCNHVGYDVVKSNVDTFLSHNPHLTFSAYKHFESWEKFIKGSNAGKRKRHHTNIGGYPTIDHVRYWKLKGQRQAYILTSHAYIGSCAGRWIGFEVNTIPKELSYVMVSQGFDLYYPSVCTMIVIGKPEHLRTLTLPLLFNDWISLDNTQEFYTGELELRQME